MLDVIQEMTQVITCQQAAIFTLESSIHQMENKLSQINSSIHQMHMHQQETNICMERASDNVVSLFDNMQSNSNKTQNYLQHLEMCIMSHGNGNENESRHEVVVGNHVPKSDTVSNCSVHPSRCG